LTKVLAKDTGKVLDKRFGRFKPKTEKVLDEIFQKYKGDDCDFPQFRV